MRIIAILALTMITFSCFSQENRIDSEKIKDLRIASISGSSISIKNGFVDSESSNTSIQLYNEEGKLTEQFFANLKGGNKTRLKLFYGKCKSYEKSEDFEKVNDKEKVTRTIKIVYDDLCRESKIIWSDEEDKITEIEELIYNNENQKVSNISKNQKNEITGKI